MTHAAPAPSTAEAARQRVFGTFLMVGRRAVAAAIGLLALLMIVLAFAASADVRQPIQWGTFIESNCVAQARTTCDPVGTWVSDDGRTVLHHVSLDGAEPGIGRHVRAGYRHSGLLGGDDGVVHTQTLFTAAPLIAWSIAALFTGVFLHYTGLFRFLRRRHRLRRRTR